MPVKPQVYKDSRPAEFFEKYHRRVRAGRPDSMYKIVRVVLTAPMAMFFRVRAIGAMTLARMLLFWPSTARTRVSPTRPILAAP